MNNEIIEIENGWIKTPHGIFTPNENLGLNAYEVYEKYLYDLEHPPEIKLTTEEMLEYQSNRILELEEENKNLLDSQKIQDRTIIENDMRMMEMEDLIESLNPEKRLIVTNSIMRSSTYFNQLRQMIEMENYNSKEDMLVIVKKYFDRGRLSEEEFNSLISLLN